MRLFSYLSVAVLLVSSVVLTAYSPDLLSMVIVGFMCMITLAGCIYGLLPTISFTGGLLNGQNSIRKASGTEGSSAWVAALRIERFFQQKRLDKLFGEYCEKVQHQRETGQIVSDIDEVLNEDVLALYTWRGVIAQIPGTLTGLGILGTFVGLLLGLRNISFVTVEAALGSVQSILAGIDTAFYTSIAGVILSILFNIINNVLRNIMNRETGLFLEEFHKTVIPTTDEQARYSSRREVRQILELLDRLPKNTGNGALTGEAMSGNGGNERVLMPQILDGLRKNEFTFFLQPRYELNTRKVIGAEALVRWNHPVLGVVSPAVFIPVLESNGYITKLDQYIWEEVCKTIRVWIDAGVRPVPIAVNVTKTDILAIDVAEFFSEMLKKYRIPPKYLNIDIAKSAYLETHGALSDTEAQLQQMGFRVILDGFDGDYVELSALGGFGTDLLKLDLYGTIRGAVSTFDTFNHIPDLDTAIANAGFFMEKGGVFLFDMNTPYKHQKVLGDNAFTFEEEDASCVWRNHYNAADRKVEITVDIDYHETGEHFHEEFCEYTYDLATIRAALEKHGFALESVCDGETFGPLTEESQRYFFCATKQYTQLEE